MITWLHGSIASQRPLFSWAGWSGVCAVGLRTFRTAFGVLRCVTCVQCDLERWNQLWPVPMPSEWWDKRFQTEGSPSDQHRLVHFGVTGFLAFPFVPPPHRKPLPVAIPGSTFCNSNQDTLYQLYSEPHGSKFRHWRQRDKLDVISVSELHVPFNSHPLILIADTTLLIISIW